MELRDYIILGLLILCVYLYFQVKKNKDILSDIYKNSGYLEKKYERLEMDQMNHKLFKLIFNETP